MNRPVRGLAVIVAISLMLSASTRAQTPPRPAASPAPVFTPPPRTPDPELDMPDTDTAKRVTGLGQEAVGGADCRAQCAKTYYLCQSNDDSGLCAPQWSHCVTSCPAVSSNF